MNNRVAVETDTARKHYLAPLLAVLVGSIAWLGVVVGQSDAMIIGDVDWLDVLGESAVAFYSLALMSLIAVLRLPNTLRRMVFVGLSLLFIGAITDVADEFIEVHWVFITAVENFGKSMGVLLACYGLYKLIFQARRLERHAAWFREVAELDELTSLRNRRAFNAALASATESADLGYGCLALALIDVDNFKSHNDRFGHVEGDKVLRALGYLLNSTLRADDCAFRYGGEEFAVLFCNSSLEEARGAAERIRAGFSKLRLRSDDGVEFHNTLSAGVAICRPGDGVNDLLRRADAALYKAKNAGRDCVIVESPELALLHGTG